MATSVNELISGIPSGSLETGEVSVSTSSGVKYYNLAADGSTNDKVELESALDYAAANMPATVTLGPGDYAIAGGIEINPAQGAGGLSIIGAGANVTKITMAKGAALSAGEYHCFLIEPSTTPEIGINTGTSATVMTDADGAFTASALVGSFIHNVTDPGSVGTITANDTTTITCSGGLAGGSANTWASGDEYRVSSSATDPYASYIHDVIIDGIGFFDNDPETHDNGSEESHGVAIKYCKDAQILNCKAEDIGDEAFDMNNVIRGKMIGNHCINTPSIGNAGIAISIGIGSKHIVASNNMVFGTSIPGVVSTVTDATGIGAGVVATSQATSINDIVIADNTVEDFVHGLYFNNADTTNSSDINNVSISGNVIRGCTQGVTKSGGSGNLNRLTFAANTVDDIGAHGINFDAGKTNTFDIVICDNNFGVCATAAMKLQVTRANLSNNIIKSCPRGIWVFDGLDIAVSGGLFDACGGAVLEEIEVLTGTNISVSGVLITNSASTSGAIKGVQDVHDCTIERSGAVNPENMIFGATNVTGCNLQGGIRLAASVKAKVCNNTIVYSDTGAANSAVGIVVAATNDNSVISDNVIDLSGSTANQYCIDSAADNCVIVGNNLLAQTAGAANALNDTGAGSLKSNVTT